MTNLSAYPDLVIEWDNIKNEDLSIHDFSHGSNKKVWWKCKTCHNSWQAIIANRTLKKGKCPQCVSLSQRKRLSNFPHLVKEFNNQYNVLEPSEMRISDRSSIVWNCVEGHMWKASVKDRIVHNVSCTVCANPENYLIFHKDLLNEFDTALNVDIVPDFITSGSSKIKIFWRCAVCQNVWQASTSNRIKHKTGCPNCHKNNHQLLQRNISLKKFGAVSENQQLMTEWNYDKNIVSPDTVSLKSTEKIWWKCLVDHEWMTSPNLRYTRNQQCPFCSAKENINNHYLSKIDSKESVSLYDVLTDSLKNEWFDENNDPRKILPYSHKRIQWKCSLGHVWRTSAANRLAGHNCPECWSKTYVSKGEQELQNYIKGIYDKTVLCSSKKVIYPYELDIYVPDLNIAFEFNGIYWHRESMLEQRVTDARNYHYMKWKKCKDLGIQLITIWEDDWNNNKTLIQQMISHKLNVSMRGKISARKTEIQEISSKNLNIFLNETHIQGSATGSINIGLFDKVNDNLVAVASFKHKNGDQLELVRYSTSTVVQGGLGKIISFVEKKYTYIKSIVTFADNEVSNGALYEKLGFTVDKILPPDYKYIYKNARCHKFLFRKKRFEADPAFLFDSSCTESQLAKMNNLHRVWDCGKTRYVKYNNFYSMV